MNSRFFLNFNSRFLRKERGEGGGGDRDETEIHKLRIFHREGKNFRMARCLEPILRSPLLPPLPKFRNILRVSPARRGFNGVRCSGNKLEFLRLRVSGTLPSRDLVYAIVTLPQLRTGSYIYFNFILLQCSNRALHHAAASRNEPRRWNSQGRTRRDEKDYLFTLEALSRNLAYFILKPGLLNPEWNKTVCSYHISPS